MSDETKDAEAEECVRKLLGYLGEDPGREGLVDTPRRGSRTSRERSAKSRGMTSSS